MELKSRKLIVATVLFISATTFVVTGNAGFTDWAEFMKWCFAIYAAGNIGEHYTNKE